MNVLLLSLILIFQQLLVIRWVGTEVNVFAYLQNLLLICCFIGFGIGLLKKGVWRPFRDNLVGLLALVTLLVCEPIRKILAQISVSVGLFGQSFVAWNNWYGETLSLANFPEVLVSLALLILLMLLITRMFVPLGALLGDAFEKGDRLKVYGLNLIGSLLGVWVFFVCTWLHLPPSAWLGVLLFLLFSVAYLSKAKTGKTEWILALATICLSLLSLQKEGFHTVVWSPYQKLAVKEAHAPAYPMEGQWVTVNDSGYQIMLDLRKEELLRRPELYTLGLEGYTQYDLPFRLNPIAHSALIIGAGNGNDAAGALRAGISRIVAVDIDPAIINLGRLFHPEKPYASSSVQVVNDDARAFLASTNEKFDVISFGLLDSHTTGQLTNTRLDHFVYTTESIQRAATLLSKTGVMTLTFEASKPYISDRMFGLLQQTFGHDPLVMRVDHSPYGFGGVMFVTGSTEAIKDSLEKNLKLRDIFERTKYSVPRIGTLLTTDNWPYIYLDRPTIPPFFLVSGVFSVLLFWWMLRRFTDLTLAGLWNADDLQFFFLGAGFMLLETVNITRTAILLGSSWQPTAAIISGVLVMGLLANLVVSRWQVKIAPAEILLLIACVLLIWLDLSSLLGASYLTRYSMAALITCLPLFFSGILFSKAFARSEDARRAMAVNLLGAIFGSLLQPLSLLFGIKALLFVVLGLYLAAMFCGKVALGKNRV